MDILKYISARQDTEWPIIKIQPALLSIRGTANLEKVQKINETKLRNKC